MFREKREETVTKKLDDVLNKNSVFKILTIISNILRGEKISREELFPEYDCFLLYLALSQGKTFVQMNSLVEIYFLNIYVLSYLFISIFNFQFIYFYFYKRQ